MRRPIFIMPKRADMPGILFAVALVAVCAVFFVRKGQQFHSVPGTDLTCSDMAYAKGVGPACIHTVPPKASQ